MTLNNFRLNVAARILSLVLLTGLLLYCVYKATWVVTPFVLFLVICGMVVEFIQYVEKTNREFSDFLLAIKSADFTKYSATDKRGRSFSEFRQALNVIIDEFQAARIEKEANYAFLQTVVEHVDTAIISFDDKGEIKLMNGAAKKLLHTPYLRNIYALRQLNNDLCEHITNVQGNSEPVFETEIKGEKLKLLTRAASFKIQGIEHKLLSIQNIKTEIEHTEIEAWEQLLHVLTHEIMNSMTPISSLSSTLKKKIDGLKERDRVDVDTMSDMSQGLQVIENRSIGLVDFVNRYKSLINLPAPDLRQITTKELFERVRLLTAEQLQGKGITLQISPELKETWLTIDTNLIEQVLLNLVNNAADALATTANPVINLSSNMVNDKVIVFVSDNGEGIPADNLSKIFVPFFTTKKKGSGIGLSLSKQIMRLHKGSISVSSNGGGGIVISLEFPRQ